MPSRTIALLQMHNSKSAQNGFHVGRRVYLR
jgi:hypothetical protein